MLFSFSDLELKKYTPFMTSSFYSILNTANSSRIGFTGSIYFGKLGFTENLSLPVWSMRL